MSLTNQQRTSTLEALAIIRAVLANRPDEAGMMLYGTEDATALAHAACSLAAGVVSIAGADSEDVLTKLSEAAIRE